MTPLPKSNVKSGTLKADYMSPGSIKSFAHVLPSATVTSTNEKTQYLSTLRQAVTKLQDEVNTFLTTKMDEDKALVASAGENVDDKAEEENYGEEVVEEDV